ncbi:MAG: choice-of-anchor E domain-containing protein [Bacteroidota bacterium]
MKSLLSHLTFLLAVVCPFSLFSQCAGNVAPMIIRYDTIVYGNGNSSLEFSFPKFDPALGTLLSANLQSSVALEYSYSLENQTLLDQLFKTRIVRTDEISSSALDPSSIIALNQTPFVTSLIASHQTLNYGPVHMSYMMGDSVTDGRLINFMGAGNIDFGYEAGTSASVQGPLPWQLNFTSVKDSAHFSVTYRYCTASLLSTDLLFFSVNPLSDKIMLSWKQAAPAANRLYSVQLSTDGQTFSTISVVAENNTGKYNYAWLNNASGDLYFRIQQKSVSGEIKYSDIRGVKAYQHTQTAAFRIFPTLYRAGNLHINFSYKANWLVRCYAADGRLVLANRKNGVYSAEMELPANISNGMYTMEAINLQTRQQQVTRIVVQR